MGIPKFFKHIVNEDPDLVKDKIEDRIQNIYFDLNCLIYPCVRDIEKQHQDLLSTHNNEILQPKYKDISYNTLFEIKLYENIADYITKIIHFVQPSNSIYLSIDGVAPRAKMEQQRMRRYRAIKIRNMKKEIYSKYNKIVHSFDTNCISPGTLFMYKLSQFLQKWILTIHNELKLTICLDDASNKGEGEHKILQHIKNVSHTETNCIYGLDADLIMLGLVCNSKIYLLRESLHFNKIDKNHLLYFDCERFSQSIYATSPS